MQQTTNPQKHWAYLTRLVERITDGRGYPVDPGIKETVVSIWAHGFRTEGSCAGHLDDGFRTPYIDLLENLPDRYFALFDRIGHPPHIDDIFAAYPELVELKDKNQRDAKRFNLLLRDFYATRVAPGDSRLRLIPVGCYGAVRLQSTDLLIPEKCEAQEQAVKLRQYQLEMRSFTAFLKKKLYFERAGGK